MIATYHTHGPAVAVSRGLDRDRVVDEAGNQTVVFGRRGSRPFNLEEMKKFYRHGDGKLYRVEDVSVRDGSLVNKFGGELKPTGQFQSPSDPAPVQPPRSRLVRRGE
jgi:hypothetical protein